MAFLFGTDTRAGVPVAYSFEVGGSHVTWGSNRLTGMTGGDLRTAPFDTVFEASDLDVSFSDTNGEIWGSLGHGTTNLGSSFSATVYIGGTMEFETFGPGEKRLAKSNSGNSATFLIHSGKIRNISRSNREVRISSKNLMAQIKDLVWRFPIGTSQFVATKVGDSYFVEGNPLSKLFNGSFAFSHNDKRDSFSVYCYVGSYLDGTPVPTIYPTPSGRGTLGLPPFDVAYYPGTQFYYDYDRYQFKGTRFGKVLVGGTIDTFEEAQYFGFENLFESEAAKTTLGISTYYVVDKTKLTFVGDQLDFNRGSGFVFQWPGFELQGNPATLWREILTGCCVLPLFGTSDIDSESFGTASNTAAFLGQESNVPAEGGAVLPFLKDLMDPVNGRMSISPSNKFRLHVPGPKLLNESLATIQPNEVISSGISVDEVSRFNRIVLDYSYSADTGSYSKRAETKGSGWAANEDYPKFIKSKWVINENEANMLAQRLFLRYNRAVPILDLETPLSRAGLDIGSLIAVNDDDCVIDSRIFEVSSSQRDFCEDRKIKFEMLDAESLYRQKGFAFWEDGTTGEIVSGTSTSGWGTNGTVNNINTEIFGTVFSWF